MWGAIEGGGSKFLCAVGEGPDQILARESIPTTTAEETFERVCTFFESQKRTRAIGVGMFGPLDLRAGRTLNTPKPGWSNVDVHGILSQRLGVSIALETDVNAAAISEWRHNANPFVYLTVGTGVGGGLLVRGEPVTGSLHPEMGHVLVPRHRDLSGHADSWPGACPFHGACVEGLASATAIRLRTGVDAASLADAHAVWPIVADALAHLVANIVLLVSPERIVLGGGVMRRAGLRAQVGIRAEELLASYVQVPAIEDGLKNLLIEPAHADSGLRGAFALAMRCT